MEYISTLDTFDDLVESGMPPDQARKQVKALNKAFDGLATKKDLETDLKSLENRLENKIDTKFNLMYILGSLIFGVQTLPILEKSTMWQINAALALMASMVAFVGFIAVKKK